MTILARLAIPFCVALLFVACPGPGPQPTEKTTENNVVDAAPDQTVTPPDSVTDAVPTEQTTPPKQDPAVAQIDAFIAKQAIDKSNAGWRTKVPMPPKATFDAKSTYVWVLQTNKGTIEVRLFPDVAPMHVSSTIYLTRLGFYDTLIFHRIIPGFMAQGGDPLGKGTGGPGYKYGGEFSPKARHDKAGILSMAHAGPGTDGSQFFLTFKATPWLDDMHTVFGETIKGLDVLKAIETVGSKSGAPSETITITKATIEVRAN